MSGYPWEVSGGGTGQPRPLLLWGTGRQGELALEQLGATTDFAGVIHNLPTLSGGSWKGLPRLTPRDALVEGSARPYVIVATMFLEAVAPELERHGYVHGRDWCHLEEAMAATCPPALAGQLAAWRARLDAGRPLTFRDLAGFDDEFWLWLNLRGADDVLSGGLVAPLPEPDVQRTLTGTAGSVSLTHGFNQFRLMRGLAERAGLDLSRARRIGDFGCGYGRIVRFFTEGRAGRALRGYRRQRVADRLVPGPSPVRRLADRAVTAADQPPRRRVLAGDCLFGLHAPLRSEPGRLARGD